MKKRKDFVEVVESSSKKTSRPDIFGFLKEEPKQEPIVEEVKAPVEYKFNFKETVKEERKVSRRNVFDILVEKPTEEPVDLTEKVLVDAEIPEAAEKPRERLIQRFEDVVEEPVEEKFSQSDVDGLEKFADRILKKYNIDVEFTRHFVDRLNDPRNNPEIKVAELQRFFKKIQKNKGKDIRQNPDVEVVLKDLASDINLPVVINYKDGEFEVVNKTIMRKKDFKTPDKVIKYEEVEETVEEVVEEPVEEVVDEIVEEPVVEVEQSVISKSVDYLHNNREEVVVKSEYDMLRDEFNVLKKTIATQFGKMHYGGGGSSKIMDNDDVVFKKLSQLSDNDILIFSQELQKFTSLNIVDVINSVRAELEVQYDKLIDETTSGAFSYTYVGEAAPGSNASDAVWRIKRVTEETGSSVTTVLWANDSESFDKVWDNRATYTYDV